MANARNIPITLNGTDISGLISFAIGETVDLILTCLNPITGTPLDLTNAGIFYTVSSYRVSGAASTISHQAVNGTPPTAGIATAAFAANDTVPSLADPIRPGIFRGDFWWEDISGNRISLGSGTIALLRAERLPGAVVTPLPSQLPLGQGPPGLGLTRLRLTANATAAFMQHHSCDPTSASFSITLPLASSYTSGANVLSVKNIGYGSGNTVTIVPSGSDVIDGAASVQLSQGEARFFLASPGLWESIA